MSLFGGSGPSPDEILRENAVKVSLSSHLRHAVQKLQKQHVNSDQPIYSEDTANGVCNVLEAIFLHGLKPSISKKLSDFLGGTPEPSEMSYWEFVTKFSHRDVVAQLNHLGQITTHIGMCRAWVRLALNDSSLESYLTTMLRDPKTLRTYYRRTAYLRDLEQPTIMVSYIQGLCAFRFQLSYNSSVLNIWTPTPLGLAGLVGVQAITPQPVISAITAEEALPDQSPPDAATSIDQTIHIPHSVSSKTRMVNSIAYTDSTLTQLMSTPPNTPYDPSHISPNELEHMRRMIEAKHSGSENSSTATSQISHPDSTDQRIFPQHCVSPQTSTMGEQCRSSWRDSGFSGDVDQFIAVPGVVRSKVQTKNNKKKKKVKKKRRDQISEPRDQISERRDQISERDKLSETTEESNIVDSRQYSDAASGIALHSGNTQDISAVYTDVNEASQIVLEPMVDFTPQQQDVLQTTDVEEALNSASAVRSETTLVDVNVQSSSSTIVPPTTSQNQPAEIVAPPNLDQSDVNKVAIETSDNEEGMHSIYSNTDLVRPRSGVATTTKRDQRLKCFIRPQKAMSPAELSIINVTAIGVDDAYEADNYDNQSRDHDDEIEIFSGSGVGAERGTAGIDATRGNSLGRQAMLHGWSSQFDEQPNLYDTYPDTHEANEYVPAPIGGVRPNYIGPDRRRAENERAVASLTDSPGGESAQGTGSWEEEFEILTDEDRDSHIEGARLQTFKELMTEIQHERGLDFHNFQCKGCKRHVGLFFCNPRVCSYDGGYYCYECHENSEYYIPARILHNWDFHKYPVSQGNLVLLKQFADTPLVNINTVNPRLYEHVQHMQEVKLLRTQLRYLKAYLFTCQQSIADEFRHQVKPKEYLYDDIHTYTLLDILQIPTGQLSACLSRLIKFASKHVYDCRLCSGKGFICEICDNPKVIYPFEMDSTYRCSVCEAVYHRACKTSLIQCPKCKRILERQIKLGKMASITDDDYACSMELSYS